MKVKVYVEGGGNTSKTQARLRQALGRLFEKHAAQYGGNAIRPSFDPSGGREETFAAYKNGLKYRAGERSLVLIDSEAPKRETGANWEYLRAIASNRDPDKHQWANRPPGALDDDLHFMVQSMESWLAADPGALRTHYGPQFDTASVESLRRRGVESLSPNEAVDAIRTAARKCPNRKYRKSVDCPAILEIVDPARVRQHSNHAAQFLDRLSEALTNATSRDGGQT